MRTKLGLILAIGIALGLIGGQLLSAQRPLERTEILKTDMAGMEGQEAHMWVAEIAPGAATARHSHPTPRFVYVIQGSVTVEFEGGSPEVFKAGEALGITREALYKRMKRLNVE